jgi:hypothetical protein
MGVRVVSKSFKQSDVFPLIHRLITDRTFKGGAFIGHADLVEALLESAEGQAIVATAKESSKLDTRGVASNMIAWFSQRYTTGENQFSELLERKKIEGRWAYRYVYSTPTFAMAPADLSFDVDATAFEGNPKLVTHVKRERNPQLVKAKLAEAIKRFGSTICECCGFDPKRAFPTISSPIVEVHHRMPLAESETLVQTKLEDLAILCPTCHRAIHRSTSATVDEFKATHFDSCKASAEGAGT